MGLDVLGAARCRSARAGCRARGRLPIAPMRSRRHGRAAARAGSTGGSAPRVRNSSPPRSSTRGRAPPRDPARGCSLRPPSRLDTASRTLSTRGPTRPSTRLESPRARVPGWEATRRTNRPTKTPPSAPREAVVARCRCADPRAARGCCRGVRSGRPCAFSSSGTRPAPLPAIALTLRLLPPIARCRCTAGSGRFFRPSGATRARIAHRRVCPCP